MLKLGIIGSTMIGPSLSLENGLARTPPMGWLAWQRFACNVNADLIVRTAIAMENYGFKEAGYTYINLDDCWSTKERGEGGKLVPDPANFPILKDYEASDGIASLSKFLHSKKFHFGIYTDIGVVTCQRYPGLGAPRTSGGGTYMKQDIAQLVEWGVDALKVDGCGTTVDKMSRMYSELSDEIMLQTENKRKIMLSCSWPAYDKASNHCENDVDMRTLREKCNLWRNSWDINDSWETVKGIANNFARKDSNDFMVAAAGPGHWNDPDMLVIGTPGLSISEQRAQFALWAILAAPLYLSVDIDEMMKKSPQSRDILVNKKVIAVNQDKDGKQGFVLWEDRDRQLRIWIRKLSSEEDGQPRFAVLFMNNFNAFGASKFSLNVAELGWTPSESASYSVEDLHKQEEPKTHLSSEKFTVNVDVSSCEMFLFKWLGPMDAVDSGKFPQDRYDKPSKQVKFLGRLKQFFLQVLDRNN